MQGVGLFILAGGAMFLVIAVILFASHSYSLDGIKSKTVGDGQHGTARFASPQEIRKTYHKIRYDPKKWRKGKNLPRIQGLIVGSTGQKGKLEAYVDDDDIHCLMIGAAGIGKTSFFLYPNLEYTCAAGMSFFTTDTKGDLYRNYASIAEKYYGYHIGVIDLRNPTRSHGNNMLHLVNKYMDQYISDNTDLRAKAKAEKYAKIIAKTIIFSGEQDASSYGQNAFFYDSAEGLLTSTILLLAEFGDPKERHIISVFKLIQDLLEPSEVRGRNQFQLLLDKLPESHKARWFAGAALNTVEQSMQSVLSTTLSRLNAFLDSELEQILCFDSVIDAERFCNEKTAIFLCLPEEDTTKHFLASLFIEQLYREILAVADETDGRLKNRVMMFLDEFGTFPKINSAEMMFSASRSRGIMLVPLIQSIAQLQKNYGKEGAEIIIDNCQDTIFSGFAPNSETAKVLSEALGTKTVLSGSITRGRNDPSQSLQMIERPLMTPDELKGLKKGDFIVTKTGAYPMRTKLQLYTQWGIRFEKAYRIPEQSERRVYYANKEKLHQAIEKKYSYNEDKTSDEIIHVHLGKRNEVRT